MLLNSNWKMAIRKIRRCTYHGNTLLVNEWYLVRTFLGLNGIRWQMETSLIYSTKSFCSCCRKLVSIRGQFKFTNCFGFDEECFCISRYVIVLTWDSYNKKCLKDWKLSTCRIKLKTLGNDFKRHISFVIWVFYVNLHL